MDSGSKDIPSPKPSDIEIKTNRRGFLRTVAGLGALAAASLIKDTPTPQTQVETREQLRPLSPNVVMIDFAPNSPKVGINQTEFPQEDQFIKSIVGNEYVDEQILISEFGPDFRTNEEKMDQVFRKYPKVAIAYGAIDALSTHGERVARTMQATWKQADFESNVFLSPLQDALNITEMEVTQDELGNKGYFFNVDEQVIIDKLKQYPNQKVVNFSFQVGKVGFFIQEYAEEQNSSEGEITLGLEDENGNIFYYVGAKGGIRFTDNSKAIGISETGEPVVPMTSEEYSEYRRKKDEENPKKVVKVDHPWAEIRGAYEKDDVENNLPKLFEICTTYPDKLFIVAAGNEGEDLRGLQQRPTNLLIVGQWDGEKAESKNRVLGADIYVDNREFGLGNGSSFSTPVITAYASILLNQGLSFKEVRNKILTAKEDEIAVFDPSKLEL